MWAVLDSPGSKRAAASPHASGSRMFEPRPGSRRSPSPRAAAGRSLRPGSGGPVPLDFGCGVGRLARALGRRARRDGRSAWTSPEAARVGSGARLNEERDASNSEFVVHVRPRLGRFEEDSFDFVYSTSSCSICRRAVTIERYRVGVSPAARQAADGLRRRRRFTTTSRSRTRSSPRRAGCTAIARAG